MTGPRRAFRAALRARHPALGDALVADAVATARLRGERAEFRSRIDTVVQIVRLACVSDAYLAQALYRGKAAAQRRRIPVLPRICHRLAMISAQVSIGDPVLVAPGLYLAHGQVVIDGIVEIGAGVTIFPWVTIGLRAGEVKGATIGTGVTIGTGAKIIGPVTIGDGAVIGAGAVVVADVAPGSTVVGNPARSVGIPDKHDPR